MASFDIIEASGKAYAVTFSERRYLARMAFWPVMIKIAVYFAVIGLGWQQYYLRQAVIMLPAFFAEGWLLAHYVRFLFLGQRWPFRPTGDKKQDMSVLQDRARGVLSGALFYALAHFFLIGLFAAVQKDGMLLPPPSALEGTPETDERTLLSFFLMLGVFCGVIWAFRFIWLYIPASINYPVRRFLTHMAGFNSSFYLIGVWLICFVPFMLMFSMFSSLFLLEYYDRPNEIPLPLDFVLSVMNIIVGVIVSLISTAGVAYGIESVMRQHKGMLPEEGKDKDNDNDDRP